MKFSLTRLLKNINKSTGDISSLSSSKRKKVLKDLANILLSKKEAIKKANKEDISKAQLNGKNSAFIDRLAISEEIFIKMITQVNQIAGQKDYSGEIIEKKTMSNGLILNKIRVPLGVVGIIYESRPNITIDVAALCIKSGNAVLLRGGSDSFLTNKILVECVHEALQKNGISKDVVGFIVNTDRRLVTEMLKKKDLIDVIIPRGGYDLVKKVVNESKIPVLYHASGGARIYIDKSADLDLAVKVCVNAKISRPATCNSLDTVVVHKNIAKDFLQKFEKVLGGKSAIRADKLALKYIKARTAVKEDYETEFLDYIVSIKVVSDFDEALVFVQRYSKKHTEGIIAEDKKIINRFVRVIDAAAIFVNASTRLHDGGVFGLGAEMGIATGKLHVRGPVGAKDLTTYKWIAYGEGQVRV